jgi:ubiquinone/menaquinone biosynthesis C-methylase UbiE
MSVEPKPRTADVNGRLWGARVSDWANIQEGTVRPVYQAVLERTRVKSGTRYLDVGCGAGMATQIAAARGAQVSGIDAAEALLDIARRRTPGGDFRQGDLEELPFDDHGFDVVTGFNSLQYAGNPAVALGEAQRVTRPGGAVVIVTWGDPTAWRRHRSWRRCVR